MTSLFSSLEVRGVTDKIKSACQLDEPGLKDLRRTLEGLAYPAVDNTREKERK